MSETQFKKPPSSHNTVRFNTVSATWWGHNGDLAGGSGHIIKDNIFADNPKFGVFTINLPGAFPMNSLSNSIVCRNSFVRGGGNYAWQKHGAVWIYAGSTSIDNVLFQDNLILNPIFRGIQLTGGESQNITFERNIIDAPVKTPFKSRRMPPGQRLSNRTSCEICPKVLAPSSTTPRISSP